MKSIRYFLQDVIQQITGGRRRRKRRENADPEPGEWLGASMSEDLIGAPHSGGYREAPWQRAGRPSRGLNPGMGPRRRQKTISN